MDELAQKPPSESDTASTPNEPNEQGGNVNTPPAGTSSEVNPTDSEDADHQEFWRYLSVGQHIPTPIKRYARHRYGLIMARQSLKYWQPRDPEDNKATVIPADEHICVPVVWATELYTPTTFVGLERGLPNLLDKAKSVGNDENIMEWLRSARRRASGAWRILPPVVPPGRAVLGGRIEDELPGGIASAQVAIYMLTSAVAAVTVRFRLDNERSRGLQTILNSDLTTRTKMRADGGHSIEDVFWQKQQTVAAWHTDLQADVTHWLADRLPGSFSNFESAKLPIVELLLTTQICPWDDTSPRNRQSDRWLSLLDLTDSDVSGFWQCISIPWLRLRERRSQGWIRDRLHIVTMATRRADLLAAFPPSHARTGDEQLSQALHTFDFYAVPVVNRWALTALVSELEDELKTTRDLAQRSTSAARSARDLDRLQRQFLHFGIDGQIALADIVDFAENKRAWEREFLDFGEVVQSSMADVVQPRPSLAEAMRKDQIDRGKSVIKSGADLREVLSASAELTATAENLRLQRRVLWLTVASFVVAFIAGAATVAAFYVSIKASPEFNLP